MTKLAEAYLHLKVDIATDQIEAVNRYFQYYGGRFALEKFGEDYRLEVRVEEGSLKTWITVLGALYAGISSYGSFRSGIDYLVKDSRQFSENVISKFESDAQVPRDVVIRTERRLGIPGKIQRIYRRIDSLERLADGEYSIQSEELKTLKNDISYLLRHIDSQRDRELLLNTIPSEVTKGLPSPAPLPEVPRQPIAMLPSDRRIQISSLVDLRRLPKFPPQLPKLFG